MPSHGTSRNNVSLNTGPDEDDHYDQLAAFSVQTINDNFDALWRLRPKTPDDDVSKLTFSDGENGVMNAHLKAPRVMIDPNQEQAANPVIYFSVRFDKDSSIQYSLKQKVDISGWVLTVTASMEELCVTPVEGDDEDTIIDKKMHTDRMKRIFKLKGKGPNGTDVTYELDAPVKLKPGEYAINRLFAAISESSWKDIIWKYSTCPDPENPDGDPIPLKDWLDADGANHTLMRKVKETLKSWAEMNQTSAFFTLGLKFKEPEPDQTKTSRSQSEITLPYAVRLLSYPYIDPQSYDVQMKVKGASPRGDIWGDYNCLVHAETTGTRPLPKRKLLSYCGNLGSPVDSVNRKEVRGTFVLDHRTFLRRQLLLLLQEMCVGALVVPLRPDLYPEGRCQPRFCVGAPAPSFDINPGTISGQKPAQLPNDSYYEFKPAGPRTFKWEDNFVAPGSGTETYTHTKYKDGTIYRHWKTDSKQSVTITWEPAGHVFNVKGTMRTYHWQGYSTHKDFPFERMHPIKGYWGDFEIGADWSFKVDLKVPQEIDSATGQPRLDYGVIEPTVEGIGSDGLPRDANIRLIRQNYDIGKTWDEPLKYINKALKERLAQLTKSLLAKFRNSGRFVYPALGVLKYEDPMIADNGDVYCNVDYLPPKDDGLVTIRKPDQMPFTDPLFKQADLVNIPSDETVRPGMIHLQWSFGDQKFDAETNRLAFKMTASNPSEEPIAFRFVEVSILVVKPKPDSLVVRMFEEDTDEWKEWTPPKPKPAPKPDVKPDVKPDNKPDNKPDEKSDAKKDDKTAASTSDPAIPATSASPGEAGQAGTGPAAEEVPAEKEEEEAPVEEEQEEEAPAATWRLTTSKVENGIKTTVLRPDSLKFKLAPTKMPQRPRVGRFILQEASGFTLELQGTAPGPGTYVMQMGETWAPANKHDNNPETKGADAFYKVVLEAGKSPVFESVTAADAEKLQGVVNK
ncbi:hypothetical protein GGTG_02628 [Gaeumannomyces tritici R3-111a-1]|uniref:Uncharacterized protein n=1 Tax=Gaeumannomyces tritici (strain R3-111a-1) TaxID=644352 RepID=J3NMX0_GAET3|nr:hypothetical protein GGTG_02628 [Gaeumannomyces tritici R3-111a-1]EJT77521.1 hypothetical protein GGTG_02628 [Gaeumannomyces tritici R3-111a-1]